MMFDDDQERRRAGDTSAEEDSQPEKRRERGSGAAAAAGAGGAGLGAGAAAGIVGGDEVVDLIRERTGGEGQSGQPDMDEVRARIEEASAAARDASFDVFESRVMESGADLPAGVADAAGIIGDSLPPVPAIGGTDRETPPANRPSIGRPEPEDIVPAGGESPQPGGGRPSIGRPDPNPSDDGEEEAPEAAGSGGPGEDDDIAPAPPSAPGAPNFPAPPASSGQPTPPPFPSPPSGGPSADPAPPAGSGVESDEVVAESPAPPSGPAPSGPGDGPAPAVPPPGDSEGEDVPPVSADPASSGETDAPVSGSPVGPADEVDAPVPPVSDGSGSSSSGSSEPAAPPSSGPNTGSPSAPPSVPDAGPSSGSETSQAMNYPYIYAWDDDGHWVDVALQNDHGDVYYLRYQDDGSVYYLNQHGEYHQVEGDHLPHLLYVDEHGLAYFSKIQHHDTVYFSIDTYGDFDWVHYDDIPGYQPVDDEYDYPRTVEWDADEGWVTVLDENGHYVRYDEEGNFYEVDQHGNQLPQNGFYGYLGDLLYVNEHGNAYFRGGEEGNYNYFVVDHDGGLEYVQYEDIPGYEDLEPPYEGHAPYFFDEYPNPFFGDIEPDGEPTFANGVYQQTYNNGQIIVTSSQEGGPYQIRYYSEDNAGGYLQLNVTYNAYDYDYDVNVYPYDYFDHVEEDFELQPIDHYVDFAYLGIPYDNMQISNSEVEYYWYDDDGDLLQKTTVNRITGEVIYQYDDLYIHVDQYGNEYYEGFPDANWEPPAGYGEIEDLYPPYGMPPYLLFGQGYDYEAQYADPEAGGYELISATPQDDPSQWQFRGPNGEHVIVSKLDDYTYQFAYQTDPNATPGNWDMVMNVTTDQYGNYISYEPVGGDYYDDHYQQIDEEYYDTEWSNYYDPHFGFEHPYDIYGQPDAPGENQAPNTYVFGGGRAVVVHNADGSETITWYSEGGYQDGHIEYKATVEYEGGQWVTESVALPTDLIPVFGILPVEGSPVYDPYHADQPYGEPDSVTILEDRVIVIWETDEGQVRSEWYRDGSHQREIHYPDGLVIYGNGADPWSYDVPDGWTPPDYGEVDEFEADGYLPEGAPDFFDQDIWPNPETDPRFELQEEAVGSNYVTRDYRADLDGDGTYDYTITVTEWTDGSIYLDYRNIDTGEFEMRAVVSQDEYGNYAHHNLDQPNQDGEPQGVPPYGEDLDEPYQPSLDEIFDRLPDNLPAEFEGGYDNPEYSGEFHYSHSLHTEPDAQVAPVHFFTNADGSYTIVMVENPNGTTSLYWYDRPVDQFGSISLDDLESHVFIQPNGEYTQEFYEDGAAVDPPLDEESVEEGPEDFGGDLPDGTPDTFEFGGREYLNPVAAFGEPVNIVTYDHGQHVTYWYEDPESGERYLVNFRADGTALIGFNYDDDNYPELIMEIRIDDTGSYADHEYVGGSYWHEYRDQDDLDDVVDEHLPEWLPESFDGWPSPTDEGFEYQYTGTGDGNENHFYSNGQYTIMVTDYGDGTGRVLIDDLSNGQGWDTGYDLYDYGEYSVMDDYVPDEPQQEPEDNYLPEWMPESFDGWPSPMQEGFQYEYTGTGDGNQNHFYSNGQYTIMVTDYGDGTGRVLIDDLSNGQGWDTGYDLYDYGEYSLMDVYVQQEEEEAAPEEEYLPGWLPASFDGWPSPTQEGFEYQYTGTGDGNQNHFYSNGQYTIMVTDYGDGTGRVLIDDLSNGQGWDTGYDLYNYGQYSIMDVYVPEEEEPEPVDDRLPEWLPVAFGDWPSPTQEGFEYQYTGTGDGNENHFYSNGQYTIMVTDYGDGTGRVLIDDLSNGQGWDTGYDLYNYGQYAVMDSYAGDPEMQSAALDQVVETTPSEELVEARIGEEDESDAAGETVPAGGAPEEVAEVEAAGGVADEADEQDGLEFIGGDQQPAETEGEEPLTFNGPEAEEAPETVAPVTEAVAPDPADQPLVEAVEIVQPELAENEELIEPVSSVETEEFDDEDLDDDGTGL